MREGGLPPPETTHLPPPELPGKGESLSIAAHPKTSSEQDAAASSHQVNFSQRPGDGNHYLHFPDQESQVQGGPASRGLVQP